MKEAQPKVFLMYETCRASIGTGVRGYLEHVGVPDWATDAATDAEECVEVASRTCYRSFAPGLNPNITRVREGNRAHLANILEQRHGSVLEHASVTFAFCDVSRVFTHELVRHRAGVAISQESLRYVRLTDLKFWIPPDLGADPIVRNMVIACVERLEHVQRDLARETGLDDAETFAAKKKLTSALRRLAPLGLATTIIWTANFRTLRFVLEQRTDPSAEEEIRLVFDRVASMLRDRYPSAFQDFSRRPDGSWVGEKGRKV